MAQQIVSSSSVRRIGLGVALLGALVSGGSLAYPYPGDNALLVIQYYDTPARDVVVGQHVNGTCQNGPYPIDYGRRTEYTTFYNFVCGSVGGVE